MEEVAYWDSASAVAGLGTDAPESFLRGRWEERNWRNVPGPFYGAETDTCLCGPPAAPRNVLCDGHGQEFVWHQPQTVAELRAVLEAAWQDPFCGYGADGDEHWTPQLVIEWWDQRERVIEWLASDDAEQLSADANIAQALAAFHSYIHGPLRDDLHRYADWLSQR